jgi:Ca-activated chloride channel family protein
MKLSLKVLPAVLACSVLLAPAAVQPDKEQNPPPARPFRIQVDMVSLPVVVTNGKGEYVTNLKREDFAVFDNGAPQEIAGFANVDEPVSVALLLDNSDSMSRYSKTIQDEAIRFVSFLKQEDRLAILSFNDSVVLWESFSLYGRKNPDVIRQMEPRGLSAVYEGVWLALEQVLKLEYGRKALVLFSDGIDNRSQTVTEEETLQLARKTEATIYSIYFSAGKKRTGRFPFPGGGGGKTPESKAGREYLMKLSGFSGGTLVDSKDIGDLGAAFRKIARDLSSRYSIGYYPDNLERNGEFHRVEVRLKKGGYDARTKEGYYAPEK